MLCMRLDVVADIMWYSLPDIDVLLLSVIYDIICFRYFSSHMYIVYRLSACIYIFHVLYVIPCDVRFYRSCIIFQFLFLLVLCLV